MKNKNRKSKRLLISLIVILSIVLASVIGWFCYVGNYYRADDEAKSYLTSTQDVTVTKTSDLIEGRELTIFEPTSSYTKAFVFYPGGLVEYSAYSPLLFKLAEQGILCINIKVKDNLAILDINAAEGIKDLYPNIISWYIGGHSLGGVCASQYVDSSNDVYNGIILLAAYSAVDLKDNNVDILSLYGTCDGVMNKEKYDESMENYDLSKFTEFVITGGCHAYFGSYGAQDKDGTPTITKDDQLSQTVTQIVSFVNK